MKLTNILLAIICLLLLWNLSLQYRKIELLEETAAITGFIRLDIDKIKTDRFHL